MNDLLPNANTHTPERQLHQDQDLSHQFDPSEPLPDYTRSWGAHLRRPSQLPEHYDTRIDPSHIFLFAVHPVTGIKRDFYVTPKPCEYCAKIRQVCSRSRPSCQRCAISGDPDRVCRVEAGWVKLPGPKCEKPKLQKRSTTLALRAKAGGRSSSPLDTIPIRTRTIAPHPSQQSLSPLSSTPTPSSTLQKMMLPKRAVELEGAPNKNGSALLTAQATPANSSAANSKRKVVVPKVDKRKRKRVPKKGVTDAKGKEGVANFSIQHIVAYSRV